MKFLSKWLLRYKSFIFGLLGSLGFWGMGLIAVVDSGTIPVPMDVLIATYVWNDRRHFFLYVLLAAAGSAVGGLVPFLLGRAGGELFLLRRINRTRYEQMMARFEKQEFLAMAIPSALPPPTPWKAFAFGAGVFEMPVWLFMLAVFTGRFLRFGVGAVLTIRYGPEIVHVAGRLFQHHLAATLGVVGLLLIGIVAWSLRKRLWSPREPLPVEAEPPSYRNPD
jgi:membrane protein YqaA with SNARE-associated domain